MPVSYMLYIYFKNTTTTKKNYIFARSKDYERTLET